jgi:hypothetical protein
VKIEIKSPKQENGLWGMPLQCNRLDRIPISDFETQLKHSAICIGVAEKYPKETFEIFWTTEAGFFIKLSESGFRKITYENYTVDGNILYWNEID